MFVPPVQSPEVEEVQVADQVALGLSWENTSSNSLLEQLLLEKMDHILLTE